MRVTPAALVVLCLACATAPPNRDEPPPAAPAAPPEAAQAIPPAEPPPAPLQSDTAMTTVEGATFIAPAGWTVVVKGQLTLLSPPEEGSHLGLVDVHAKDADSAVAAAWAAYKPDHPWALKAATPASDKDGWTDVSFYDYQTSPNEKRRITLSPRRAGDVWTVRIYDMADAVGEKRTSAVALVFGRLLPKGYQRETFAGKTAHSLDKARVEQLTAFVQKAMKEAGVPGVSLGIVQGGKVVFAGGFGARALGSKEKPDADTLYMIASNTKAMTTLMLAKLVESGKVSWDTPVTSLLPSFKLGDAETTRQVLVRHLICACTGLPRQDLEWLFQFQGVTPAGAMATLATVQPTSKFGEMFQYSNLLAASAGYVGGHVAFPQLELGAAYDKAMGQYVFGPLGMKATTFDYARALKGNHASPHAPDADGTAQAAAMDINYAAIPVRPAGAAWSNVRDVLAYVSVELAQGALPNGKRYIAKEPLLERRAAQVSIGKDETYGMGLEVDTRWGTPVVHHGGSMIGFKSDMMWLPEHGVGAVILTNSDTGGILLGPFQRKLLEVLFDGKPEADADFDTHAKAFFTLLAAERKRLTLPAEATVVAKLAPHYTSPALGDIAVRQSGGKTTFDFGEWRSEVGSRVNADGTVSLLTTSPGVLGFEFVVGGAEKRMLTIRDGQHEYVFVEE
jgi:CubicO group peptidase (beta-lactamase class C family)